MRPENEYKVAAAISNNFWVHYWMAAWRRNDTILGAY